MAVGSASREYKRHNFVTGKEEIGAAPEDVESGVTAANCFVYKIE